MLQGHCEHLAPGLGEVVPHGVRVEAERQYCRRRGREIESAGSGDRGQGPAPAGGSGGSGIIATADTIERRSVQGPAAPAAQHWRRGCWSELLHLAEERRAHGRRRGEPEPYPEPCFLEASFVEPTGSWKACRQSHAAVTARRILEKQDVEPIPRHSRHHGPWANRHANEHEKRPIEQNHEREAGGIRHR